MIDGATGTLCLVVTDITRENPSILNHLLDDVLMPCLHPRPCVSARIGRFEGRKDGALW